MIMIFMGIRYRLKKIKKNREKNAFNKWHNIYEKDSTTGVDNRSSELVSRGIATTNTTITIIIITIIVVVIIIIIIIITKVTH